MNFKNISKKSLGLLLTFIIIVFIFLCVFIDKGNSIKVSADSKFSNDFSFFNALINSESTSSEKMVDYNSIHNIIEKYMNDSSLSSSVRDEKMSDEINEFVLDKRVTISTPEELYYLSVDACYNWKNKATANIYPNLKTIKTVLSFNYCLINDIDYSKMKSKQFIPLGIDFITPNEEKTRNYYPFTGSFDGNGFKIKNLYLAGYDYISMIYRFNQDDQSTEVDIALNNYYSMFASVSESGIICNLIIENPIFELLDIPDGLTNTSILVGENNGLVYNTAVIDKRTKISSGVSLDDSGIIWNLQLGAVQTQTFYASGLVNKNNKTGKIYNSYYISQRVVSSGSSYLFKSYPIVCENSGEISGVCYNDDLISTDNLDVLGISAYSSEKITTGENININSVSLSSKGINDERIWHFYASDSLPQIFGLEYDESNNCYLIKKDIDLITFSKLLSLKSKTYGKQFNEHTYVLNNNIDMKNFNYPTPKTEFKGVLKGGDDDFSLDSNTNNNKCILNLNITTSHYTEKEVYYGLVGINKGTIKNINFIDSTISLVGDNSDYGKVIYAGIVSAYLSSGNIKNITNRVNENTNYFDFSNSGLGKTCIGGIVGYGSGNISYVCNLNGAIDGSATHNYTDYNTSLEYYYGGIIGGSSEKGLRVEYAYNNANIKTINNVITENEVVICAGGIIGNMNNNSETSNEYFYLTNDGSINGAIDNNASANIYVGGVFGKSNNGIKISKNNRDLISGRFENNGIIVSKYNASTKNYLAGIGVNTSDISKVNFSYMINNAGFEIENYNSYNNNRNIYYSSTILDNGNGIILSRAYNEASYTYDSTFFNESVEGINISSFFMSVNDKECELLYCQNNGNITIDGGENNVNGEMKVAGITLANKVDYKNVSMCGNIIVNGICNNKDIYISGISWILPSLNNKTYKAINCINEGKIITSNISGNTSISGVSGTSQTSTSFRATINSNNLYVAGLFNLNVGSITNSMNRADITSDDGNGATIIGTCNTFVGGIVTFNYNFIQDCANSGDITYINSSSGTTYVAGGDTPNCLYGGLVFAYNGGLALGGVVSAMADTSATILAGYSDEVVEPAQIVDSSNNGNISGKANQYVRSGGILAVALGVELTAGTASIDSSNNGQKKFSWCTVGNGDRIANCKLSNGLNFGNITAISNKIGNLDGTRVTSGQNNGSGTSQGRRPGIFACSGGVISYGLCIMTRMLNHGVIVSTDVAGGIVGATYVLGSADTSNLTITYCNIDTAIHYGKVKAAKYSNYSNFTYTVLKDITNSNYMNNSSDTSYIYKDENTFIFPSQSVSLSLYPNARRGFGGIFGRLQRGNSGVMQSNNFVNILNMDSKVDMIGRVDGSSYGAYIFYRLKVTGKEDTYYSARSNDTTQALVVGYTTGSTTTSELVNALTDSDIKSITITRTSSFWGNNYTYRITSVTLDSLEYEEITTSTRRYAPYNENINGNNYTSNYATETVQRTVKKQSSDNKTISLNTTINGNVVVSGNTSVSNLNYSSNRATVTNPSNVASLLQNNISIGSNSSSSTISQYQIEIVTDDKSDTSKTYIFSDSFPLMDSEQANYIYAASNDVLADRFKNEASLNYKPNGMYVLATTKGRDAGDVLPGNLKIDDLYKLNEKDEIKYIDLSNVSSKDLIDSGLNVEEMLLDYKSMFQISYSDKSLIQQKDDNGSTLYDLVLYDKNNNSPILRGGLVGSDEYGLPTITFTVSNSAFNFVNNKTDLNYYVKSAVLSENAVIAKYGITANEHHDFRNYYNLRSSNVLDGIYEASISGTLTKNSRLEFEDKIRVYSEIACNVSSLVEKYVTDYKIIIECVSEELSVDFSAVVDSASSIVDSITNGYIIKNNVSPDGKVECLFTDNNGVLASEYELSVIGLYRENTLIDSAYYKLEIVKLNNRQFGFTISFSNKLISGEYEIRYRYYDNIIEDYSIFITKEKSQYYNITNVFYNTFSYDISGNILEFLEEKDTDFITYIQFGYMFSKVKYGLTNSIDLTIETINNLEEISYLNNVDSYVIKIDDTEIERIYVSEFSKLIKTSVYYTYTNGNREYVMTYVIENEVGSINTIVHRIVEREPDNIVVYKNNNIQYGTTFIVYREDLLTTFDIDFGFEIDREVLNGQIKMLLDEIVFDEEEMKSKIYLNIGTYYSVNITSLLEPGSKGYKFILVRDGEEKEMLSIVIDKLLGKSAYLEDIDFQLDSDTTLVYPNIYEVDMLGNKISNTLYDVRTYYGGIDYDGADNDNVRYFRIDGKVTNISLDDYSPSFTNPIGSSIYRYTGSNWDGSDTNNWSTELKGDFIGNDEEKDTVILYKIVSEDGESTVYYFITASDILYNLTIRFTIYYRFANGNIVLGSDPSSPIKNQVVVITIKNYQLQGDLADYSVTIDPNDPNHIIYPYEASELDKEGITKYITGLNNQMSMFYYPIDATKYQYSFGRNYSGCYGFTAITPKYKGESNGTLINGRRYEYDIYLATGAKGTYGWNSDSYKLHDLDLNNKYDGKYYFISGSTKNRIREFALVVNEKTSGGNWGLTDEDISWDK